MGSALSGPSRRASPSCWFERVVVRLDGLEIGSRVESIGSLLEKLRPYKSAERLGGMTEVRLSPDGSTITVFVALAWRRRGGRKVIVAPPGCDN